MSRGSTPAAQNVGLVFSIAAALGKDFFRDAAKKIVELGDEYRVLGYGVAGTFSSATDLADEVLSVFDHRWLSDGLILIAHTGFDSRHRGRFRVH